MKYSQPFLDREKERETHIGVDGDGRQYLTGSMTYIKYAWPALFLSAAAAAAAENAARTLLHIHKAPASQRLPSTSLWVNILLVVHHFVRPVSSCI